MSAGIYNFTIEQGATFTRTLAWQNPDGSIIILTGYTAKMQIRDESNNILVDVNVSGTLTINGSAGTVTVLIPDTITSTLTFDTAYYDLKLTSGSGTKTRLVKGTVTLDKQVTV